MMRRTILALLIAGVGILPVSAAEVNTRSRIESVTVFPDGAEISRTFEAALETGTNTLLLGDLPATVVANSVRVEGEAASGVDIGSVDTRRIVVKKPGSAGLDDTERKRIEDEIKRLTDDRNAQDGIISAANTQSEMAQKLSELPMFDTPGTEDGKEGKPPSHNATVFKQTDWNALFDLIGNRQRDAAKAIQGAQIRQRELDEQIAVLQERLKLQPKDEWERTEIRVHADARAATKGTFTVRYLVGDAFWQPVYDARLATGGKGKDPIMTVVRRGAITQDTGEDWEDTTITLSTMRATDATSAVDLNPLKVTFVPEIIADSRAYMQSREVAMAPAPAVAPMSEMKPSSSDGLSGGAARPKIMMERPAFVNNTAYQATFKIAQRTTVKSGTGEKRVFVASEEQKTALIVKTSPRKDASAFLHAKFVYEGASPILPGEVSLYRDGVFIGRGAFQFMAKGEEKELGFGRDDGVRVARIELKRAKSQTGIISASSVDEQRFKISINNLHDWTMPVVVTEQIPVTEEEGITIDTLPETTEPTTRGLQDKRGVFAWQFDLKSKEAKDIVLAYVVKWPAKREIIMNDY